MDTTTSSILFKEAKTLFPGGVNSPLRAFKSVVTDPIFITKGKGSTIWHEDNNEYIDFCNSWGPLILGHANDKVIAKINETVANGTSFGTPTRLENELGNLIIKNHRFVEKIRFVSSGTEAAMSALRLARGVTGRSKVLKFEGCYHGHVDSLLVKAGSGLVTLGSSTSAGVPDSFAKETIVVPLNDKEALTQAVEQYKGEIACIAIEPIPANNGLLLQGKEFLTFLREICTKEGIILLFDEVISGFRIGFEGASGYYGIQPDVIAFGKVIGGGLPVGAYGSSSEIMSHISPEGDVYQAGTLSGNPVAMSAGIAQLTECLKPNFYQNLEAKTNYLTSSIVDYAKSKGYAFDMAHVASIFWIKFSDKEIRKASEIDPNTMSQFSILHRNLLERGIYLGPSGYEVGFISEAHTQEDLDLTIKVFKESLDIVFQQHTA